MVTVNRTSWPGGEAASRSYCINCLHGFFSRYFVTVVPAFCVHIVYLIGRNQKAEGEGERERRAWPGGIRGMNTRLGVSRDHYYPGTHNKSELTYNLYLAGPTGRPALRPAAATHHLTALLPLGRPSPLFANALSRVVRAPPIGTYVWILRTPENLSIDISIGLGIVDRSAEPALA